VKAAPLHARIGADIEAQILSGAWKPGHRIPAEHALMARYGCARMTVSKALSRLAAGGLIERRRRAGSFVAAPPLHQAALAIPDIRSDIEAQGRRYRLSLLTRSERAPTPIDRARLALRGDALLALLCVHFADDIPYALEERLINLGVVPAASVVDFSATPPGSWLLGHVLWSEAEHAISAIDADNECAAALGLETGTACLRLERWTWKGDEPVTNPERITWVRQTFPGAGFCLSAHFSARR